MLSRALPTVPQHTKPLMLTRHGTELEDSETEVHVFVDDGSRHAPGGAPKQE